MTSTIKVDNIQNQCGANIINESSNTITIGASGDTIALASGASQTGFGRTGTVDWNTTKKTGDFTAANGEGYFVDTSSGGVTMTMPSGSAGAIVSIQDYNKSFDDNTFIVSPASGEKINGGIADGDLQVTTEGQGLTFVYVDSTVGWKTVHENEFTAGGSSFLVATGGTVTTCGNDKIHTFTGPGTFTVSATAACATNNLVSYVVVGGGGAGGDAGNRGGGGGGAGGFREVKSPVTPYTASPLCGHGTPGNRITVTATAFPITVGAGGAGTATNPQDAGPGGNSIFSTITAHGGGGGGACCGSSPRGRNGGPGGSGGGGGVSGSVGSGGTGNTPPVTPAQGTNGGAGSPGTGACAAGGGGGGATVAGTAGNGGTAAGPGGAGATSSINGTPTARAGGGGGASANGGGPGGSGGSGGGGAGEQYPNPGQETAGTTNTGGGGGAAASNQGGANGGSGIVIIRYKFQ